MFTNSVVAYSCVRSVSLVTLLRRRALALAALDRSKKRVEWEQAFLGENSAAARNARGQPSLLKNVDATLPSRVVLGITK
jgi:hypothetical protein